MTARAGRLLLAAALIGAACAAVVALSGGVSLSYGALRVSARDPLRPLFIALTCAALAWLVTPRATFRRDLRRISGGRDRVASRLAVAAAAATFVVAVSWNTRAAGGSDSSCYILQADAFARGQIALRDPLALSLPGDNGAMFAPTGFLGSPVEADAAVPICAPGLALVMAAFPRMGAPSGLLLVVPATAALTVWLTFVFGCRVGERGLAAAAALLVATSPILLYQAVQPMSDVPAAALWMASLVAMARADARGDLVGGACFSLAVLMRPNLALVIVPLVALLLRRASPVIAIGRFVLAAAPGALVFGWLNAARYGSPLVSGYGDTTALFAVAHLLPNLARYPRWLIETHTPLVVLAVVAPWAMSRAASPAARDLAFAGAGAIAIVFVTYLAYTVFDDWWYIRFLLPALPIVLVFSVLVLHRLLRAMSSHAAALTAVAAAALAIWYIHVARSRQVFALQALESRFVVTGEYASRALPPDAVVLAVQQSGSIRHHGRRSTITWDAVGPNALDETLARMRTLGHPVFIALEDGEEPRFRARFAGQRFGALEWPPMAQIDRLPRVRIYDPEWREASAGGVRLSTEHVGR